jgi:GntR family transcriptional regulator, transcriptional repressor for pyruvate dehydrogenase complex
MKIQPRISLVDMVVDRIQTFIEKEGLAPGNRLPTEPELISKLGVSRTVLREAIGRLETIGLLTIQRGRGMFVGDRSSVSSCAKLVRSAMTISNKDWLSFAEFRAAIECQAARSAAELGTAEDFAELEAIFARMDAGDQTYMGAVEEDFKLHRKIVEMARNEVLLNVMDVVHEFVIAGMVKTTPNPRGREGSQGLHRRILDGVKSGDPDRAEKVMREHMELVRVAILRDTAQKESEAKAATAVV